MQSLDLASNLPNKSNEHKEQAWHIQNMQGLNAYVLNLYY